MNFRNRTVIVNIVVFVATLIMNFVAQTPGLFPMGMKEAGESRAILFLPAAYVFGIWGIIYSGLIAFTIYQSRTVGSRIVEKLGWWFAISSIANVIWLVLYLSVQLPASMIAMLVLLVALLIIFQRLSSEEPASQLERWSVHIPFSIYLGWITVATVANASAVLYDWGTVTAFAGLSAVVWTVVLMGVAVALALILLVTRRNYAYALVIPWALLGIYNRPFNIDQYQPLASQNPATVNTAALIFAIIVIVAVVIQAARSRMMPAAVPARR